MSTPSIPSAPTIERDATGQNVGGGSPPATLIETAISEPHTATPLPPRYIHPALDYQDNWAAVGILSGPNEQYLITSEFARLAVESLVKADRIQPPPMPYPELIGRWPVDDVRDFLAFHEVPSFGTLLTNIRTVLDEHLEAPAELLTTVACWIAGTYWYRLFLTYPRLILTGERGSGKTKLLHCIKETAFNGMLLIAPTTPILFRLIEPLRPTLALDEMEGLAREDNQAIKAILNSGYKVGGRVPRCEGEERQVKSFDVYAPVAVGCITGTDMVMADRAISFTMERGASTNKINSEVDPCDARFREIRQGLYRTALSRFVAIRQIRPAIPAWLTARPRELFKPLLTIATLAENEGASGIVDDLLRVAERANKDRERLPDDGRELFVVLERRLAKTESITVYPRDLVDEMSQTLVPEAEYDKGNRIHNKQIGRLLKRYGFQGEHVKHGTRYTIDSRTFREKAARVGYAEYMTKGPQGEEVMEG